MSTHQSWNHLDLSSNHLPANWRFPEVIQESLQAAPRFFSDWGCEVRTGSPALQSVDLAFHAKPRLLDRFLSHWQHPAWEQVKRAVEEIRAKEQEFPAEIAFEFDADGWIDGVPIPGVFLVFEPGPKDADQAFQTRRTQWALHEVVPKLRGAPWSAAARASLERALGSLPPTAAPLHFGVMLSRPIEAIRICVGNVDLPNLSAWLDALGLGDWAARWHDSYPWERLARWGHPAFINLDIGAQVFPHLGIEFHRGNDRAKGLDAGWHELIRELIEHGLASPQDEDALVRWCDADPATRRTLTHAKLFYRAQAPRPEAKIYLKSAEPNRKAPPVEVMAALERPATSKGRRMHDAFFSSAHQHAGLVALEAANGRQWTYADAARDATALAVKLGPLKGELVAVRLPHSPEQAIACLAIHRAGGAYLPIDPQWPDARVDEILELAGVTRSITAADVTGLERADLSPLPEDSVSEDDLAYVIYTSGTTGVPKGVMIRHRSAWNTIEDMNDRFQVSPGDRFAAVSSLAFDLSVYDIFGALAAGAAVVYPDKAGFANPAATLDWLVGSRITIWNSVPASLKIVVDEAAHRGQAELAPSLRCVLMSGDWIPVTLPGRIRSVLNSRAQITSLGGATEASVWSILHPIQLQDEQETSIPYGGSHSMRAQQVLVLDEFAELCAVGQVGELFITGEGVAAGYWRAPALTAQRFVDLPGIAGKAFKTGDLGKYRDDGNIIFLGRKDHQAKIQGYRVDLSEIEAALVRDARVKQAAVVAPRSAGGEAFLAAYCVLKDPVVAGDGIRDEILQHLREGLPKYLVPHPSRLVFVSKLPLTDNEKVDRARLADASYLASVGISTSSQPRPSEEEQRSVRDQVRRLFEDVLATRNFKDSDSFFQLGGDSLLSAGLMARLAETTGVDLPLSTLFRCPSVEELAQAIDTGPVSVHRHPTTDAELPDWYRFTPPVEPTRPRAAVLLTGATGFLGSHLLDQLLTARREGPIYCLVRADGPAHALERLHRARSQYGLPAIKAANLPLVPVTGDLSKPHLGLSETDWERLRSECGDVIHAGADVNFTKSYDELWPSNVQPLLELFEFCGRDNPASLHYVSSMAVFGTLHAAPMVARENDRRDDALPVRLPHGYWEGDYVVSKWVAERLVWQASERGLPVTIHRPAFIFGSSIHGAIPPEACFPLLILRECVALGFYPDVDLPIAGAPVDEVARAIVQLSGQREAIGGAFHLTAEPAYSWLDWVRAATSEGMQIAAMPFQQWRETLQEQSSKDPHRYRFAGLVLSAVGQRAAELHTPHVDRTQTAERLGRADLQAIDDTQARQTIRRLGLEKFWP